MGYKNEALFRCFSDNPPEKYLEYLKLSQNVFYDRTPAFRKAIAAHAYYTARHGDKSALLKQIEAGKKSFRLYEDGLQVDTIKNILTFMEKHCEGI